MEAERAAKINEAQVITFKAKLKNEDFLEFSLKVLVVKNLPGEVKMIFFKERFLRKVFLIILLTCFFQAPGFLAADDDQKLIEDFEKNIPEYADLIPSIKHMQEFIQIHDAEINGFKFTISSGFSNHSSGDNETTMKTRRATLDIGAGCTKGFYPEKLDFKTGIFFLLKGDQLSEDVTSLHLSYDHHLIHFLESFAFIDRSSNSYMGIQQRYEIGGGIKLEYERGYISKFRKNEVGNFEKCIAKLFGNKMGKCKDIFKILEERKEENINRIGFLYNLINDLSSSKKRVNFKRNGFFFKLINNLFKLKIKEDFLVTYIQKFNNIPCEQKFKEECLRKIITAIEGCDIPEAVWGKVLDCLTKERENAEKKRKDLNSLIAELKGLKKKADDIRWAFKKRYAKFSIGLLGSFMKDIEHAEVELPPLTNEDTPRVETLTPEQKLRFVIRPNIILRLGEKIYIRNDTYLKSPFYIKKNEDYRIDCYTQLRFELPTTSRWAKKVYLSLEYNIRWDNKPPAFIYWGDETPSLAGVKDKVVFAKKKYSELLFKINVVF